jgi:thioredoxin-related protein
MKKCCVAILMLLVLVTAPALASEQTKEGNLPLVADLARMAQTSQRDKLPILLMFSSPTCDYCARLEGEVLKPMQRWVDSTPQVVMGKVNVDAGVTVRDFSGQAISTGDLAQRYEVALYPTLVLVDERGNALVPNIVGYQTPGFYNAYLDAAIATSQSLLATNR